MAAAFVLLAGCGGGQPAAPRVDYTSAAAIAQALDRGGFACTDVQPQEIIGARNAVDCRHNGQVVRVQVFGSAQARDQLLGAFGGYDGTDAVGEQGWWIGTDSRPDAEQVARILGGKVQ